MKILVINPNSDADTGRILEKKAALQCPSDVFFHVVCLKTTPKLIKTYEDCAQAAVELLSVIRKEQEKYDAFIIACHSDPGLEAAREISKKPVWGIGEASFRMAPFFHKRMSVLVPSAQTGDRKYDSARKYFCNENLTNVTVSKSDAYEDLLEAGKKAVETGAGVIVLGCANYSQFDGRLERDLGVPVLDGLSCAMALAVGMHPYLKAKKEAGCNESEKRTGN